MYIGSLAGIPIRVHWSCLLLLGFWVESGATSMGLLCLFVLAATILVHELGHCFAARSVGGQAWDILLWPLGGLASVSGGNTPLRSLWIAAAGPLMHIPLALLCLGPLLNQGFRLEWTDFIPLPAPLPSDVDELLFWGFRLQVMLFAFNVCLPAWPLDGGQILASLLGTFVPLPVIATLLGVSTLLSAGVILIVLGSPWIALWVGWQGAGLLSSAWSGNLTFHPLSRMHDGVLGTIQLAPAVFVAPDTELIHCPECEHKLHPRTEKCVECGHVVSL